eukprot:Gb_22952 [translate_table: standard]
MPEEDYSESLRLACIDLSNPDRSTTAALVRKACLDSGFFYVINHGIDQEFFDKVFEQSRCFFSLPPQEKMKVSRNEKHRGYTPYQAEALDPSMQSEGDCKEGYYIGPDVSEVDVEHRKAFDGPNQWPSEELLPGWRETMEVYYDKVLNVGRRLVTLIALALNLDATFFDKPGMMDEPMAFVRLLHYPGKSSNLECGLYGAAAHSDYGMLTLLATDGVPGLQICRHKDDQPQMWEEVPPRKGAFVINIGDMLERWSNCLFRSTLHRVVINGEERYSVAFFLDPNFNCLVECLPSCCSQTNPARFAPIRSGDYLQERIRLTYGSRG